MKSHLKQNFFDRIMDTYKSRYGERNEKKYEERQENIQEHIQKHIQENIQKKRHTLQCINKRKQYEDSFDSKKYLPTLKASKEELHFFMEMLRNHLEKSNTQNIYMELMNFLCSNFASYIGTFAVVWNECKVLLCEKILLIEFFKQLKINMEILNHFFNCGYDSVETFLTITQVNLVEIQMNNKVIWLPGHAFRLKQIFSKIKEYMDLFFQKNADYIQKLRKVILKHRKKTKITERLILTEEKNNINKNLPQTYNTLFNPVTPTHIVVNPKYISNPLPFEKQPYIDTYTYNQKNTNIPLCHLFS